MSKTNKTTYLLRMTNISNNEVQEKVFESLTQMNDYVQKIINISQNYIREKNISSKVLNKKRINELINRVSSLPSMNLLQVGNKYDISLLLLREFLNEDARLLSECLAMRFLREDGDPAHYLLLGGELDRLRHSMTWLTVDKFEALLSLIQMCWDTIAEDLKHFKDSPDNGFNLFLLIIIESFDEPFTKALSENFKISPSERELVYSAISKMTYRTQLKVTNKEKNALQQHKGLEAYWLKLTLNICAREAKEMRNNAVNIKLQEYFFKHGLLCDYLRAFYSLERKSGGETLFWENQQLSM